MGYDNKEEKSEGEEKKLKGKKKKDKKKSKKNVSFGSEPESSSSVLE